MSVQLNISERSIRRKSTNFRDWLRAEPHWNSTLPPFTSQFYEWKNDATISLFLILKEIFAGFSTNSLMTKARKCQEKKAQPLLNHAALLLQYPPPSNPGCQAWSLPALPSDAIQWPQRRHICRWGQVCNHHHKQRHFDSEVWYSHGECYQASWNLDKVWLSALEWHNKLDQTMGG